MFDVSSMAHNASPLNETKLRAAIERSIVKADEKSMRSMLDERDGSGGSAPKRAGQKLFQIFKRYCEDPATAPAKFAARSVDEVASEIFLTQESNNSRMNAGWRYQFLAIELARLHGSRFTAVNGGNMEADIHAICPLKNGRDLHLYISIKNRSNTISGSRRRAAYTELETYANADKNRAGGPYLAVVGITIEHGDRSQSSYSNNIETWKSDFFWPFFSGRSYKDIMLAVGRVLGQEKSKLEVIAAKKLPVQTLAEFIAQCSRAGLLKNEKTFKDASDLVDFFL
jgi:hypothetical protein